MTTGGMPSIRVTAACGLLLFVLMLSTLPVHAADASPLNIAEQGKWIHDPAGELTPEQALARAAEMPADATGGLVESDGRGYWLVADLENATTTARWAVNCYLSRYERVQLTVFDGKRPVHQSETGLLDVSARPEPSLNPGYTLAFDFPPGAKRTVVLRLESAHLVTLVVDAGPYPRLQGIMEWRRVATLLGFGAILALVGYNLFLGAALRDTAYLFYGLHAMGYGTYLFIVFGYLGSLFGIANHTDTLMVAGSLIQLAGALFIYRLLEVPRHAPMLGRVYRGYIVFVAVISIAKFFVDYQLIMVFSRLAGLLLPALIYIAAYKAWRGGSSQAPYVVIGWAPMLFVTVFAILAMSGRIPHPPFFAHVALGTVVFEMMFLSLALADRVRQLRTDKVLAEETNRAKSAFLATMSHEVRSPLSGILGTLGLLGRTALTDAQRRYVDTMHTSGAALLALLNNVLDYARAEAGKISVQKQVFSPQALVQGVVDLNRSRARAKGLDLAFSVEPTAAAPVSGDPTLVRQVLLNLVGNAVKFTGAGRVSVHLSRTNDDTLRFEVEDTGPGIPASALPTLFDRFTRVDDGPASHHEGTGLGLAIAKEMTQAMGGRIDVETAQGKGSRFFFQLPIEEVVSETPPAPADENAIGEVRVLVVDDMEINREILTYHLVQEGCAVEQAVSGRDAVDRFRTGRFEMVLTDLCMPGMDGMETAREILAIDPRVAVIGVTAMTDTEQRADCLRAGMIDVLVKPVDTDLVRALLKTHAHDRRIRQAG